ncbi:ATP-dependent metallopeptidase FtsH/Yme1/Tma family protein [Paenibacillus polymyxa]|uniref:ATP-dependent metallopeptidase FtsH/Yme1/Tma family protein n=1 Tax=Paenibacillus polymyxa TaxID=1406 RepID=UPI0001E6D203|nr:FtsH/Yme1/Tma family ATP-dependent metallopeptidase [Paenibacillus polymyxa]WPQ60040.1 AAA family ATPase [Paenibacillus polymyxa]
MKELLQKMKYWIIKHRKKLIVLGILCAILIPLIMFLSNTPEPKKIQYTGFTKMLNEGKIKSVNIDFSLPSFNFKDKKNQLYSTDNPRRESFKDELLKKGVEVNESKKEGGLLQNILLALVNTLIWVAVFIGLMTYLQKSMNGNSHIKEFDSAENENRGGKHSPKGSKRTTFKQIAGHEEAKEDMQYLVDFLKNPLNYTIMGAKLPKGVIFYGPPGTGKTLFAKALAGEAGVPFFSVSGSDFVEKYVGTGASRVRDMFNLARKKAPCIIFIDEIDAIGRSRDSGSHSEQLQTLNAILKEMDGFDSNEGIIVIGATNRLDDLDSAFIRPGRFDKHIAIHLPDQKSRLDILKIHAQNKPLATDVDLESLSKLTVGLSGASLESILNESSILATSRRQKEITAKEIDDAYFKIVMQGHKKKGGDKRHKDEIRLVSWHEAGHALASKLLTDNDVPKVTIIPSTSGAGGVAFIIPKKMGLNSKRDLINDIKISYAGRAAEYLLLGNHMEITTGASSDIKNATKKIKMMITEVGMSDAFGMLNLDEFKPDYQSILDEASTLAKQLYDETVELLTKHLVTLKAIAEALEQKESLNEDELNTIIEKTQNEVVEAC